MSRSVCVQGHLVYIHSQVKFLSETFPSIESSLLQKYRFEWILVPTVDDTSTTQPILLSIPQRYSRQAAASVCDDAATARIAQVSGEIFKLLEEDGDVSLFLEVSDLQGPSPAKRTHPLENMYTLSQAARLETVDRKEKEFSLSGVKVVAVSPVLAMNRDDAFCLVDIAAADLSAVVVLRGNSLRMQQGLVPHQQGSIVTLSRLRKQRWRMRESGIGDSPAAVFVADAASSITWETLGNETEDSTVLRGTIQSVHLAKVGKTKKRLNYLEICLDKDRATIATVYMTHFPLSMADILSLRPGSDVEMRNLYKLGNPITFAACLRSGLSIVEFSTTSRPDISMSEISSYNWHRQIKPTYPSLYAKRSVAKFVERNEHVRNSFGLEDMLQSLSPKQNVSTRNAYMEFLALDDLASESSETTCPDSVLPPLVGLSQIVNQSFGWLVERLGVDVSAGWRAELHIQADAFQPGHRTICTFGRCTSIEKKHRSIFLTLSDGMFDIPVVSTSMDARTLRVGNSIWLRITHVYVSCVCICESGCAVTDNRGPKSHIALPLFASSNRDHVGTHGCCRVLSSGRSIYVASIYAVAEDLHPLTSPDSPVENNQPLRSTQSVMDCLVNLPVVDKQKSIESLLLRSRFKIIKVKTAGYGGCTLSLGHFPEEYEDAATLQQLELRPTVALENKNYSILQNALQPFCRKAGLSHEKLSLGLTWWRIATDPKTCSLLLSGWEMGNETARHEIPDVRVLVWIPGSALQLDPKRGYCRLRSTMNNMIAVTIPPPVKVDQEGTPLHFFVNQNDHSVVAGTLDRRVPRVGGGRYGELRVHSRLSGLPTMTLREILLDLAKDLSSQTRCNLRPSLVRQIHCEATFLGISYCQTQAECSKCYGALLDAGGQAVCTNGCKNEGKGIKWECSGLLDDGTGQAKLYAERETALLLLGISERTATLIEQGVWASKAKAIVFSKPMPPKNHLGHSVESARSMAAAYRRMQNRQWSGKLSEEEVLRHMPPATRAEYLLEWHCRNSHQPCRRLRYFVRCKPVADGVMHLMQTEIDLPRDTNRVSYSFPPIKLILVDCAQPAEFVPPAT